MDTLFEAFSDPAKVDRLKLIEGVTEVVSLAGHSGFARTRLAFTLLSAESMAELKTKLNLNLT